MVPPHLSQTEPVHLQKSTGQAQSNVAGEGAEKTGPVDLRPTENTQPFKPLFLVGSFVLARKPHCYKGQTPYRNPLRVEKALGIFIHPLGWTAMVCEVSEAVQ